MMNILDEPAAAAINDGNNFAILFFKNLKLWNDKNFTNNIWNIYSDFISGILW